MNTRYIITFEKYKEMVRDICTYVYDDSCNLQDAVTKQFEIFKGMKVPDNAKGFYVIDDNGDTKCVRFPE